MTTRRTWMKVTCMIISLLMLMAGMSTFAEVDYTGMTLDELLEAQEQLTIAIEAAQNNAQSEEAQDEEAQSEPMPDLDTSGYTELSKGSKGDEVKALQTRLFELGFYNISIDGDYGNGTVNAIKDFEELVFTKICG